MLHSTDDMWFTSVTRDACCPEKSTEKDAQNQSQMSSLNIREENFVNIMYSSPSMGFSVME